MGTNEDKVKKRVDRYRMLIKEEGLDEFLVIMAELSFDKEDMEKELRLAQEAIGHPIVVSSQKIMCDMAGEVYAALLLVYDNGRVEARCPGGCYLCRYCT